MFEKEIKFIADFNLNKIKSLGSFITFEKLSNSGIHPSIIQYISAELDYLINEDRKKLLQESLFDYSGSEVNKYFQLIAREIKKTKKIAYEDLKKLVIQAVSFNMNFLVRPRWSLTKLIYNDAQTKPIDEITLLINYIYYYDYIKNIFISYLSKRKLFSLSITEFESILNKIDKELFSSQPKVLVDNALYTIGEFFNVGGVSKIRISPAALEIFLKEKNMIQYLFRLKKAFPNDTKQKPDIDELRSILYAQTPVIKNEPIFEEETEKEDNEIESEIDFLNTGVKETKNEERPSIQPDDVPVNEEQDLFAEENVNNLLLQDEEFNESKTEIIEPEDDSLPEIETADGNENKKNLVDENLFDKETGSDTGIDEELLALYDKELELDEEKTEKSGDIKKDEVSGISNDDDLNSLYDFEDENKELLKDFDDDIIKKEEAESFKENKNDTGTKETNTGEKFEDIFEEESTVYSRQHKEEIKPAVDYENKNLTGKNLKPPERNKDIFDFLSTKDIDKIVGSVFNADREDFANTLERLTECLNYDEATEILKSVFLTYRVNPYSRDAVNLTNAVSNYFDQE